MREHVGVMVVIGGARESETGPKDVKKKAEVKRNLCMSHGSHQAPHTALWGGVAGRARALKKSKFSKKQKNNVEVALQVSDLAALDKTGNVGTEP